MRRWWRWRRAEPGPGEAIKAAAGERIVAFGRPGKSPKTRFLRRIERVPAPPDIPEFHAPRNGF